MDIDLQHTWMLQGTSFVATYFNYSCFFFFYKLTFCNWVVFKFYRLIKNDVSMDAWFNYICGWGLAKLGFMSVGSVREY